MSNHVTYSRSIPFSFFGLSIRELSPEGYDLMSVAEIAVPPGAEHPMARSTKCDKLYVCTAGALTFHVGGKAVQMKPSDVLLIRKEEWFSYQNGASEEGRLLLVHNPPFDLACEEIAPNQIAAD